MANYTGTCLEQLFISTDYAAKSAFTSEASILTTNTEQPFFPAFYWQNIKQAARLEAWGVLSSTGTPTYLWTVRLGTALASIAGTQIGCTAALTTGSGVANKLWHLQMDMLLTGVGNGTGGSTLQCVGRIFCDGLASPFLYPIEPSTPDTATWTATFDETLVQFLNLSVTCSANSASNSIQAKKVSLWGLK